MATSSSTQFSIIGSGFCNSICVRWSTVMNGSCNFIGGNGGRNTIENGLSNVITSCCYSYIGNGSQNTVSTQFSGILIGREGTVSGSNSLIGSGFRNTISGDYNVIGAGSCNSILLGSCYSGVLGGRFNTISSYYDTFIIGSCLTATQPCTTFVNCLSASNLTCGCQVCVGANGVLVNYSGGGGGAVIVLGAGTCSNYRCGVNNLSSGSYSGAFGGQCNTASANGSNIVGGFCNSNSSFYGFIGGGFCNSASGYYSSILGGYCNNNCGFDNTFILGSNLCASQACTTFVNCVSTSNIPVGCAVCTTTNNVLVGYTAPVSPVIKICSIPSGTSIVDTSQRLGYNSVFYNFTITDCTNYYAGNLVAVWNPITASLEFTETSTSSIGNTSGVSISFTIVGNDVNLVVTVPTSSWKISFTKTILEDCCTNPYISGALIITEDGNSPPNEEIVTEDLPSQDIIDNLGNFLVDNLGNLIATNSIISENLITE